MSIMQEEVRKRLEGLGGRIIYRNARRKTRNTRKALYVLRGDGLLDSLEQARPLLVDKGMDFQESSRYGITQLRIRIGNGVDLWYDGTGKITYSKRRKPQPVEPYPALFSESGGASSCLS